jgi:hypothetical protein
MLPLAGQGEWRPPFDAGSRRSHSSCLIRAAPVPPILRRKSIFKCRRGDPSQRPVLVGGEERGTYAWPTSSVTVLVHPLSAEEDSFPEGQRGRRAQCKPLRGGGD